MTISALALLRERQARRYACRPSWQHPSEELRRFLNEGANHEDEIDRRLWREYCREPARKCKKLVGAIAYLWWPHEPDTNQEYLFARVNAAANDYAGIEYVRMGETPPDVYWERYHYLRERLAHMEEYGCSFRA